MSSTADANFRLEAVDVQTHPRLSHLSSVLRALQSGGATHLTHVAAHGGHIAATLTHPHGHHLIRLSHHSSTSTSSTTTTSTSASASASPTTNVASMGLNPQIDPHLRALESLGIATPLPSAPRQILLVPRPQPHTQPHTQPRTDQTSAPHPRPVSAQGTDLDLAILLHDGRVWTSVFDGSRLRWNGCGINPHLATRDPSHSRLLANPIRICTVVVPQREYQATAASETSLESPIVLGEICTTRDAAWALLDPTRILCQLILSPQEKPRPQHSLTSPVSSSVQTLGSVQSQTQTEIHPSIPSQSQSQPQGTQSHVILTPYIDAQNREEVLHLCVHPSLDRRLWVLCASGQSYWLEYRRDPPNGPRWVPLALLDLTRPSSHPILRVALHRTCAFLLHAPHAASLHESPNDGVVAVHELHSGKCVQVITKVSNLSRFACGTGPAGRLYIFHRQFWSRIMDPKASSAPEIGLRTISCSQGSSSATFMDGQEASGLDVKKDPNAPPDTIPTQDSSPMTDPYVPLLHDAFDNKRRAAKAWLDLYETTGSSLPLQERQVLVEALLSMLQSPAILLGSLSMQSQLQSLLPYLLQHLGTITKGTPSSTSSSQSSDIDFHPSSLRDAFLSNTPLNSILEPHLRELCKVLLKMNDVLGLPQDSTVENVIQSLASRPIDQTRETHSSNPTSSSTHPQSSSSPTAAGAPAGSNLNRRMSSFATDASTSSISPIPSSSFSSYMSAGFLPSTTSTNSSSHAGTLIQNRNYDLPSQRSSAAFADVPQEYHYLPAMSRAAMEMAILRDPAKILSDLEGFLHLQKLGEFIQGKASCPTPHPRLFNMNESNDVYYFSPQMQNAPISANVARPVQHPYFDIMCRLYYQLNPSLLPGFVRVVTQTSPPDAIPPNAFSNANTIFYTHALSVLPPITNKTPRDAINSQLALHLACGHTVEALKILLYIRDWKAAIELVQNHCDQDIEHFELFHLLYSELLAFAIDPASHNPPHGIAADPHLPPQPKSEEVILDLFREADSVIPTNYSCLDILGLISGFVKKTDDQPDGTPLVAQGGLVSIEMVRPLLLFMLSRQEVNPAQPQAIQRTSFSRVGPQS